MDTSEDTWFALVTFAGFDSESSYVRWRSPDMGEWALVRATDRKEAANRLLDSLPIEQVERVNGIVVGRLSEMEKVPLE